MALQRKHRGTLTKDDKGTISVIVSLRQGGKRVKGNIVRQFSVTKSTVSKVLRDLKKAVFHD